MATKEQVEFFRSLHDEEDRRYTEIDARAKLYLGIVTAFLAAMVLKSNELLTSVHTLHLAWPLVLLDGVLLGASLVFIVVGSQIRTYEGLADPTEAAKALTEKSPTEKEFFSEMIANYVIATNRNSEVNDRTARYIQFAGIALAAAMILLLGLLVAALTLS